MTSTICDVSGDDLVGAMTKPLFGIAGAKGAGKDTIADLLVSEYGYSKFAFADPMRDMAEAIDPIVGQDDVGLITYNQAIALYGYTEAKEMFPGMRMFLQRLGTEAGRDVLGQNIWVDLAMERVDTHDGPAVLSDVRYRNEYQEIRRRGGKIIRVTRPGHDGDGHVSESFHHVVPMVDIEIDNTGNKHNLMQTVRVELARSYELTP